MIIYDIQNTHIAYFDLVVINTKHYVHFYIKIIIKKIMINKIGSLWTASMERYYRVGALL